MGCAGSKNDSALGRLSSYQIAAAQAESEGLTQRPLPLIEEEAAVASQGKLFPFHFHNIFYDGFYAPYIRNPDYLLIVDAREEEEAYEMSHVVTAQWHGRMAHFKAMNEAKEDKDKLTRYCHVVLYDADGSGINVEDSSVGRIAKILRELHVEPLFLDGGLQALTKSCPYLVITPPEGSHIPLVGSRLAMSWFPSIVLDGQLFLGRREQAADPAVLVGLQVTHIVCVADSSTAVPAPLSPNLNYLVVPLPPDVTEDTKSDSSNTIEISNEISGQKGLKKSDGKLVKTSKHQNQQQEKRTDFNIVDLGSQLPTLAAFVQDALKGSGEDVVHGRVLISGEQGVNRSAALVMAFLMKDRACTLEDAYYYVRRCRPAVQLSETLLKSLAHLEGNIFGRGVTNIEDLGY
ncbi:serine/threonine/tyrosine-interacting-like protein 1 [Hetaerina americana]|uniref:serine/threonine/tyrosine-interacting-like protein 1 n=1 Tax=Hetaerina americana TaxID=62018 RepID=UPI003A7F1F19